MIKNYTDHAANERTFLAWVRTGIAVIAFGFVVEKFNVFMLTIASAAIAGAHAVQLQRLAGPLGRFEGLALIIGGILLIVLSTVRFVRTSALLDDPVQHAARTVSTELILSAALVLMVTSYSIYIAFG